MRNNLLVLVLILLFTACSVKQNSFDINHYSINFKADKKVQKAKLGSIFIEDVHVNKSFNLTSIFYNTKPFLFEKYVKNKWLTLPSDMIYNQLKDSFISSNIFTNVISKDSRLEHDYTLKTDVLKLFHVFEGEKSYAILKIKFDLVEDKKIIKSIDYDKKILCDSNDAYGFVKAVNKSFDEVTTDLLTKFSSI